MLSVIVISFLLGAVGVLCVQVVLFWVYLRGKPRLENPKRHQYERARISEDLRNLEGKLGKEETAHSLNAIFGFLWGELKDTRMVRRWVVRKLNVELDELLHTKTAGRVIEQITVRDYCLGSTLPTISNMSLVKCNSSAPGKAPEEVDVALSLKYTGGFRISVDVDLVFGTSAYVSITVTKLEGRGRLSFTKHPFSHWSFSFFEEPELEFTTKTHFEGRVVPQLSGLIVNQIKKTIRKKHILPAYKLRYKPFFIKPEPPGVHADVLLENSKLTVGILTITVVECTRLPFSEQNRDTEMYCSLSIGAKAWNQKDIEEKFLGEIFEVEVIKGPTKFIGVTFQSGNYEKEVLVSTISIDSPAINKNLRQGDRVLYVDNVKAQTPKQVARLVKQAKDKFVLKVQRPFIWFDTMDDAPADGTTDSKNSDDQKEPPPDIDEPDNDNDYEEFIGPITATFETLGEESRQEPPSPCRLEVPGSDSPVLRHRGHSKQPTGDDGRRHSSSLDYETAKQLGEKLQQTAEVKIKNVKSKIQESITNIKEKRAKNEDEDQGELDTVEGISDSPPPPSLKVEADPDTVSLSSISQFDEPMPGPVEQQQQSRATLEGDQTDQQLIPSPDQTSQTADDVVQETTLVKAETNPRWEEAFTFQTKEADCYINVCVWNRIQGTFGERDLIIGYTSVPLIEVAMQCLTTLSGEYLELFKLHPPELQAGASRNEVHSKAYKHPGYEHRLAFGDVTLYFNHDPQESMKPSEAEPPDKDRPKEPRMKPPVVQRPPRPHPREGEKKALRAESKSVPNGIGEGVKRLHVFLGTHFSTPTRCDFCKKKVWTKFAYQCQGCHLICHKKCSDKTQMNIPCDRTKKYHTLQPPAPVKQQLDVSTDPPKAPSSVPSSPMTTRKIWSRVPSSQRLSSSSSEDEGDESINIDAMIQKLEQLKTRLIQERQGEMMKKEEIDHMMMTAVREKGRALFTKLDIAERKLKLETIINHLQKEIDTEAERQANLFLKKEKATSNRELRKTTEAFSRSEHQMQTLAMLMLHYCSGMQHCNEALSAQADEVSSEQMRESKDGEKTEQAPSIQMGKVDKDTKQEQSPDGKVEPEEGDRMEGEWDSVESDERHRQNVAPNVGATASDEVKFVVDGEKLGEESDGEDEYSAADVGGGGLGVDGSDWSTVGGGRDDSGDEHQTGTTGDQGNGPSNRQGMYESSSYDSDSSNDIVDIEMPIDIAEET